MPSPTLQGYRWARYLWGRWPLSTAYSFFHSGPSLSAPLTSPGILAGPQLTCSGSLSLRTWLHAALKCLSWSFGVMVLNMKTLKFSEKLLCVVCCYRCIIKWRPPCGPLTPSLASWLFSDILSLVSTGLITSLIVSLYLRHFLPCLSTVSPHRNSTFCCAA